MKITKRRALRSSIKNLGDFQVCCQKEKLELLKCVNFNLDELFDKNKLEQKLSCFESLFLSITAVSSTAELEILKEIHKLLTEVRSVAAFTHAHQCITQPFGPSRPFFLGCRFFVYRVINFDFFMENHFQSQHDMECSFTKLIFSKDRNLDTDHQTFEINCLIEVKVQGKDGKTFEVKLQTVDAFPFEKAQEQYFQAKPHLRKLCAASLDAQDSSSQVLQRAKLEQASLRSKNSNICQYFPASIYQHYRTTPLN